MALIVNSLPANAGVTSSIPESGRCPGGGHANPLQYSCLGNPMGRGAWRAVVHGVTKSWTWLKWLSMHIDNVTPLWSFRNIICSNCWYYCIMSYKWNTPDTGYYVLMKEWKSCGAGRKSCWGLPGLQVASREPQGPWTLGDGQVSASSRQVIHRGASTGCCEISHWPNPCICPQLPEGKQQSFWMSLKMSLNGGI